MSRLLSRLYVRAANASRLFWHIIISTIIQLPFGLRTFKSVWMAIVAYGRLGEYFPFVQLLLFRRTCWRAGHQGSRKAGGVAFALRRFRHKVAYALERFCHKVACAWERFCHKVACALERFRHKVAYALERFSHKVAYALERFCTPTYDERYALPRIAQYATSWHAWATKSLQC